MKRSLAIAAMLLGASALGGCAYYATGYPAGYYYYEDGWGYYGDGGGKRHSGGGRSEPGNEAGMYPARPDGASDRRGQGVWVPACAHRR